MAGWYLVFMYVAFTCIRCVSLLHAQGSKQDIVVFPQLLTLPIKSRLGPRVLYARKRNIKLLAPHLGTSQQPAEVWRQHKMVPLNTWLSASDKGMCALMGLDHDDYQR